MKDLLNQYWNVINKWGNGYYEKSHPNKFDSDCLGLILGCMRAYWDSFSFERDMAKDYQEKVKAISMYGKFKK